MKNPHRLSSADFRAMRPARRVNGEFFALSMAPRPLGLAWACVVSKKVAAKAVTRNFIKRRCRSILQAELKNMHEPRALVLHAKRQAATASFAEIREDIRKLFGRIT